MQFRKPVGTGVRYRRMVCEELGKSVLAAHHDDDDDI